MRFGIFELDESSGELRRNGSLVHLPPQPFQILMLLARNAGEVVERNRIRREVWGDTAVDFDRSLNVAIAQIRSALNDVADNPRFIQTLPRKGYRLLAAVDRVGEAPPPAPTPRPKRPRAVVLIVGGALLLVGLAAGAYRLWRPSGEQVRIAVLPFENLSHNPADAIQADGLFDELLTRLGGIQPERIQVIGRRSVSYLNAHGAGGLREIGERLQVGYAIEGSARRDQGGWHVAVRFVRTGSETVLWSATFTQDASPERFEEALVSRVSAAVLTTLFPGSEPRTSETGCSQGWEAYQTGRLLANRGGVPDLERSLPLFRQGDCAQARAALAQTLVRLARMGRGGPDAWESARNAAQKALQAGSIAAAHLALGNVAFWHDWNWQAARHEFGEALRINPSDPDAHHDRAWLQVALGLRTDALASLETAIAIDPLSARTRMDSAWLLLQIGRFDQAAAEARRTLELDPGMLEARACLFRALLYAGDTRAAIDAITPLIPQGEAGELAGLPNAQAVRRIIELGLRPEGKQSSYERAWRLAWLGSRGEALTALEEGLRSHNLMMPLVAVDPAFAVIRDEARFRKIVQDMKLAM